MNPLRLLLLTISMIPLAGCMPTVDQIQAESAAASPISLSEEEMSLKEQINDALDFTYEHRHLNLEEHAAWQILHGALTYQNEFMVRRSSEDDEMVSAVEHLLSGGEMAGWTVSAGDPKPGGGRGLRAALEEGSKAGQGHYDQWLAVLSQCGLDLSTEIIVRNETFTLDDFVWQVQYDVPTNRYEEFSWTLIALTGYLPTDATWIASDGETWSIADLVRIEAEQAEIDLADGACGGTHRLIGLTMALDRHMQQGGKVEGPWIQAQEVIDFAIQRIRNLQNSDGSLSTNWLNRGGISSDLALRLSTTGHQLEFLALAMRTEDLQQSWVRRAAESLCQLFKTTESISLECGALYHATHGLALYRDRRFGEETMP